MAARRLPAPSRLEGRSSALAPHLSRLFRRQRPQPHGPSRRREVQKDSEPSVSRKSWIFGHAPDQHHCPLSEVNVGFSELRSAPAADFHQRYDMNVCSGTRYRHGHQAQYLQQNPRLRDRRFGVAAIIWVSLGPFSFGSRPSKHLPRSSLIHHSFEDRSRDRHSSRRRRPSPLPHTGL